jgi:hypothetical protein
MLIPFVIFFDQMIYILSRFHSYYFLGLFIKSDIILITNNNQIYLIELGVSKQIGFPF